MNKRIELIFTGNLDQGFSVRLELGPETDFPTVERGGTLPATPSLAQKYRQWRDAYRTMVRGRIQPISMEVDGTPKNRQDRCRECWQTLGIVFQEWLAEDEFRSISDCLLQHLQPLDQVRILIRSDNWLVHRLPWHSWSLLKDYPLAEVALAATEAKRIPVTPKMDMINILAVLGDSTDIDTAVDLSMLEQLPQATVVSLTDTTRQQLSQTLAQQSWQMLFFAGHSETATAGLDGPDQGIIHLGSDRSLTLDQLKHSLRGAIANGLQVAMFNSCDGLGLAYALAPLQMPLIIIMREPVPDEVAQRFLKIFLQEFSQAGSSLYVAVRRAREVLEDEFEPDIPGVSGLPIIWQHPLMPPMAWPSVSEALLKSEPQIYRWLRALALIVLSSLCVSTGVLGARYLGWLQPWELQVYDQLSRLRARDGQDSRFLIVKVTEEDIDPEKIQAFASISDGDLEKLLGILFEANPRVVGLDIIRDFAVRPDYPRLANHLSRHKDFVSICTPKEDNIKEIEPAPEANSGAIGFATIHEDNDRINRRHLLHISEATGACKATYALSTHLALRYLEGEGVGIDVDPQTSEWRFGEAKFRPLALHQGGYHRADLLGEQILLRYRLAPGDSPLRPFREVTLGEVLAGDVGADLIRDRVVLIGTDAHSFPDIQLTPYRTRTGAIQEIPGVVLQAHFTSQLIDAGVGDRALIQVWHPLKDSLWIWAWAMVGGGGAWRCRRVELLSLGTGIMIVSVWGICWWLLCIGNLWVPLVPTALASLGTTVVVKAMHQGLYKSSNAGKEGFITEAGKN